MLLEKCVLLYKVIVQLCHSLRLVLPRRSNPLLEPRLAVSWTRHGQSRSVETPSSMAGAFVRTVVPREVKCHGSSHSSMYVACSQSCCL